MSQPSASVPFAYPRTLPQRIADVAGNAEALARRWARRLLRGESADSRRARAAGDDAVRDDAVRDDAVRDDAVRDAITGRQPIVYLPAVGWEYRFQRPQQLAVALARHHRPVLYCDPFARRLFGSARRLVPLAPGLWRLDLRLPGRPDPYRHALPAAAVSALAHRIADGLLQAPQAVLVQLPFWGPVGEELRRLTGAPLVYDRIDRHGAFPGIPPEIPRLEERLLAAADHVTVSAEHLLPSAGVAATIVRNAVALEDFTLRRRRGDEVAPRVGYAGALAEWLDAEALEHAARELPEWRFRLAGRVEDERLRRLADRPNVELLGEIPYAEIPPFLAGLDVAIVPFRDTSLTRAVDPVKLYEALAAGLPVVARRLPETERWSEPDVFLYADPAHFAAALRRAIGGESEKRARQRRSRIGAETWARRAEETDALLSTLRHARTP